MAARFTVLYVDDEPAVREAVAEVIGHAGYRVLIAGDGYEAIRHLMDNHVDLLLTDLLMPGFSGLELAQQVKLLRPHMRVLYLTGTGEAPPIGKVLCKPLRAAEIVEEIGLALAE